MIRSFRNPATEAHFHDPDACAAEWVSFKSVALRKLDMLDAALELKDLRSPPGNRFEALKNDRAGTHSIRINDRWRLCFTWTADGPADVEIVDYHP